MAAQATASLHCAHTILLLFLSHFSTIYLLILVVSALPRLLGSEVGVLWGCLTPIIMGL